MRRRERRGKGKRRNAQSASQVEGRGAEFASLQLGGRPNLTNGTCAESQVSSFSKMGKFNTSALCWLHEIPLAEHKVTIERLYRCLSCDTHCRIEAFTFRFRSFFEVALFAIGGPNWRPNFRPPFYLEPVSSVGFLSQLLFQVNRQLSLISSDNTDNAKSTLFADLYVGSPESSQLLGTHDGIRCSNCRILTNKGPKSS